MIGFGNRMSFPPVIKNLLIINGILFLCAQVFSGVISINGYKQYTGPIYEYLALHNINNDDFGVWQFVTHMFVHDLLDPMHIFFNMFALWMFGRSIESRWGSKRFLSYYIFTGIGAAILHMIITGGGSMMFGASGAVFGILLAFGMVYPNTQILLLIPPMPIKAKYLVIGYGLLELYLGYGRMDDGIAHFAHLGGMLFGLLVFLYWKIKNIYY